MSNKLHLVLGNQLFPLKHLPTETTIFLAEDAVDLNAHRFHKQRICLYLSAIRHYKDELNEAGFDTVHAEIDTKDRTIGFETALASVVKDRSVSELSVFEIEDHAMDERVRAFAIKHSLKLRTLESPMFLVNREGFADYIKEAKRPNMATFYQSLRKKTGILMDGDKPVGGKYSFDSENRKKAPSDRIYPFRKMPERDYCDGSVLSFVNREFPNNPGSLAQFNWATTRSDALARLDDFLENHFASFGTYQDAIVEDNPTLHHSLLSPYINLGLITPKELLDRVMAHARHFEIPLNSLEGFVRQLIGWREFVRGIYHQFDEQMQVSNHWDHHRKLNEVWYTGETGIPPLDAAIHNVMQNGYTHHIERLMVIANLMNLCEIHPKEVYRWFMELFVDSADWVMAANVYGMGLMSDGGIFATKPYISGSNYIRKMSHYPKGPWCDVWDGLYWRFIDRNRDWLSSNPRLSMSVRTLDRMDRTKFQKISDAAEAFLMKATTTNDSRRRLA
jgi:deoxyribodipyrimidine photolyase-related protein